MKDSLERKDLETLIDHFGVEKVIAALPQKEVCEVLGLYSMNDLAILIDVPFNRMRSLADAGKIPYPEVRLLRRPYYRNEQIEEIKQAIRKHEEKKCLTQKVKST